MIGIACSLKKTLLVGVSTLLSMSALAQGLTEPYGTLVLKSPSKVATLETTGIVKTATNIPVQTPFRGRVREIYVTAGQGVKRGDALWKMDTRPLEQELSRLNSDIKKTRSKKTQVQIEYKKAIFALETLQNDFQSLDGSINRLKVAYPKSPEIKKLSKRTLILRGKMADKTNKINEGQAFEQKLQAQLDRLLLNHIQIEEQLEQATVRAPVDGKIYMTKINTQSSYIKNKPVIYMRPIHPLELKVSLPKRLHDTFLNRPQDFFATDGTHEFLLNSYDQTQKDNKGLLYLTFGIKELNIFSNGEQVKVQLMDRSKTTVFNLPETAFTESQSIYRFYDNEWEQIPVEVLGETNINNKNFIVFRSDVLQDGDKIALLRK